MRIFKDRKQEIENSYAKYYYLAKEHVMFQKIKSILLEKCEDKVCYIDRCLTENQKQRDVILSNNEDLAKCFLILAHEGKETANYELYYKLNPETVCQEEEEEKWYFKTEKNQEELSEQIETCNVIIDNAVNVLAKDFEQKNPHQEDFVK